MQFLLAGTGRSLEATWRAEVAKTSPAGAQGSQGRRAPGAWWRAYTTFRWEQRASEFDAAVFEQEAQAAVQERVEERARHRAVAKTFLAQAAAMVQDVALVRTSPAAVSAFVLRALEAHRRVYGADPLPEDKAGSGSATSVAGLVGTPGVTIQILGGGDLPEDEVVELTSSSPADVRLRLVAPAC